MLHQRIKVKKRQLAFQHIFRFCKTLRKLSKNLGFHITFKTADLQDTIFNRKAIEINVTFISLYLFLPVVIANSETKVRFSESTMNEYTITFDSWYIERKVSNDGRELQVDTGSAQHVNSPKYLIAAFQTTNRIRVPANSIASNLVYRYY